tara:strand:- start:1215 stop:2216 length:1002 start_codon:yes stop_codon:yes gene_type:complete
MILHLKKNIKSHELNNLTNHYSGFHFFNSKEELVFVASSTHKSIRNEDEKFVNDLFSFDDDVQLSSKNYIKKKREININGHKIGGETNNTVLIGGPCAVESTSQIHSSAKLIKSLGLNFLRGGCFKPRTSPYSFQGLGKEGLDLLIEVKENYNLNIITEVKDSSHVDEIIEYSDIIQIGAKAMYDQSILRKCSKSIKPVMIKRGFGSTIQEFLQAAEFILSGGNENVILCERGIRTFEVKTRFTLDLCAVSHIQHHTNLPIFIDPSHALGFRYGVKDLSMAALAMNSDGIIIETHPNPDSALSDKNQQIEHEDFIEIHEKLKNLSKALNRNLI